MGIMTNLICYCLDYTDADIEMDLLHNGKSTIMEKILAEKQMGGCQCATKNPQGRRCLADVQASLPGSGVKCLRPDNYRLKDR